MFHQYFLPAESNISNAIKTLKKKWFHLKNIEEVDADTLRTMERIIKRNPVDGRNLINRLLKLLRKAHEYSQSEDKKKTPENPTPGNPKAQMWYMNALITSLINFYRDTYKNKYVNLDLDKNKKGQGRPLINKITFH